MIILIAAIGENNELGKDNQMLWHLPEDFKHFKNKTMGHAMLMGRKTLESLPGILPGREHIVLTRDKTYSNDKVSLIYDIEEALALPKDTLYVIGGGQIYTQFLPHADRLELTRVKGNFKADVYFPEINFDDWELMYSEAHSKDEKHKFDYVFETWERKDKTTKEKDSVLLQ